MSSLNKSVLSTPIQILTLAVAAGISSLATAQTNLEEAASVSAGPVEITPVLGTEAKYSDNIYRSENQAQSSWIYLLRPELSFALQDRENVYELVYYGEAGWYQDSEPAGASDDYFDNTVYADAHIEFTNRYIMELFAGWAALHEDRGTGLSEGALALLFDEPIRYDNATIGGSFQFGGDESFRILLSASYLDKEYQNFRSYTEFRDYEMIRGGVAAYFPITGITDLFGEYGYRNFKYPYTAAGVPSLDSTENSLTFGAQWKATEDIRSTVKGGYINKDFDDGAREDWDGFTWSVDVTVDVFRHHRLYFIGYGGPEETKLLGSFIDRQYLTAQWMYDWSERIYTKLGATYGTDDYVESIVGRDDTRKLAVAEIGYEFRRWANFYAAYNYENRDSNLAGLSYDANIFRIGVDFSL